MFITLLLFFILIMLGWNYYVHYGRNGRLINLIPGPPGYPIIQNITQFIGSQAEQWKTFVTFSNQYYPIFKFWAVFLPIVNISHPDDFETILSSKHMDKEMFYDVLQPWLGDGLLLSTGAKWHSRRKILTPTFHFNILQQFVKVFIEESENMTKSLKRTGGAVIKDLVPFISQYALNAICETAMGISLENHGALQKQYRNALKRMGEIYIHKLTWQWLYPMNWIFSLTSTGREEAKVLKILHGFTEKIIAERKLYHERTNGQYLKNLDESAKADDAEAIGTQKRRLAMLDLLIVESREGLLTDSDIREEVDTFMFAGHDTTSMTICFILALLAEHKDIQECVRNEIDAVMQKHEGKITMKSLQQLSYLERCIKEGMRLYPVASLIARDTAEDVKLQSYVVPAGTTVQLFIYGAHRDPNFWPDPEAFDPDRFLPENTRNRHPYLYIPFSAGPHNCIGQKYAMLEIKVMVAYLIQNFYVEPIDYLKDVQLNMGIIIHSSDPIRVKFVPIS